MRSDRDPSPSSRETDLVDVPRSTPEFQHDGCREGRHPERPDRKSGWYIKLDVNPGEKVLAPPVRSSRRFTTPAFAAHRFRPSRIPVYWQGRARVYILPIYERECGLNLDLTNDIGGKSSSEATAQGRSGSAIPSGVIITFIRRTGRGLCRSGRRCVTPRLATTEVPRPINWRLVF